MRQRTRRDASNTYDNKRMGDKKWVKLRGDDELRDGGEGDGGIHTVEQGIA